MAGRAANLLSFAVGGGLTYFAAANGYLPIGGSCKCCGKTPCACSGMSKSSELTCPIKAVCMLTPDNNSGVSGTVRFEQLNKSEGTKVTATVSGLTKGKHGFHIHEYGDLRHGCASAKGHYNPFAKNHGGPTDDERHVGDLGNIIANDNGVATLEWVDKQVQLCGPYSVLGRAIVVHAGEDDLGKGGHSDSLTTGHAGGRVACGVIGIASE